MHERSQSPLHDLPYRDTDRQMSFGSPLPNSFGRILSLRLPHPPHLRDCLLGHRFNQKQLAEMGLIDGQAEPEKLMERCLELGVTEGARVGWGVWGIIKVGHDYLQFTSLNHHLLHSVPKVVLMVSRIKYIRVSWMPHNRIDRY